MKGLHKNSLRKGDNPHQWMIDDARQKVIRQIRAEVERLENYYTSVEWYVEALLSFLDTLQEQPDNLSAEDAMKVLDEKIAKVKKDGSWKNTELLDEMRGEQFDYDDIGDAVEKIRQRFPEVGFAKISRIAHIFYHMGLTAGLSERFSLGHQDPKGPLGESGDNIKI